MAGQTSLQVIEGAEKALRANDWTRFGELHAENVVLHAPDQPEPVKGRAAVIEVRERGAATHLVYLEVQATDSDVAGGEPWAPTLTRASS